MALYPLGAVSKPGYDPRQSPASGGSRQPATERTPQRQLTVIKHPEGPPPKRPSKCNEAVQRMRRKFDTPFGRDLYSRRMGTVEPVFGNIQNKGMRRFTLRGQKKVSAQWKLFTMVHNIEKVAGVARR